VVKRRGGAQVTEWEIHGRQFGNCNCDYGCPCQFGSPRPTRGFCEAVAAGEIDRGHFGATRLDGLRWVLLLRWPGAVHEGNGTQQAVIDARADAAQRAALRRILHGEDTQPGATHFYVYRSTMSRVLDPVYAPIDFECDVAARRARVEVPGLVEARGEPIRDAATGAEHRVRIDLPHGFEYRIAEIGRGFTRTEGQLRIELRDTYGQFNELHLTQRGVVG
jgi:hypothetical protein